jgi:hypothetical protein
MTTITFKVDDAEARRLRLAAQREHTTISEYLRRRIRQSDSGAEPVKRVKCRYTGATVLKPSADTPTLTTQAVKAFLRDFP